MRVLFPEGRKRKYQEHKRIFTRKDSPKPVLVSTWGQSSHSRVNVTAEADITNQLHELASNWMYVVKVPLAG